MVVRWLRRQAGRLAHPVVWRRRGAERETTLALRGWLPLLTTVGVLVWYLAAPTRPAAMSLAALGGMLAVALVWAGLLARHVTARRELRYAAMQVGDELEETVTLENAAPLPLLWVELVDHSAIPGYSLASVRSVDSLSRLTWRANAVCTRRGRFRLGPWALRAGDPFGLFLVEHTYFQQQELVVYPALAALPQRLLPHTPTQGEQRLLRQPLPAETLNALTVRVYAPGDPLRRVHWPASARHNALYTKVFEPEATARVWLIADLDPAAHLIFENESTEELLVLLAASLAAQLLQRRLAVGLIRPAGPELEIVPARPGPAHLWLHLRALAAAHPEPGTPALAAVLRQARPLISARDLIITLTPSLNPEWPRALLETARRGARAEALLLDPASFGGPASAAGLVTALAGLGLATRLVQRGEIQPITAAYGAVRHWEFLTTGTGRAIATQTPRATASLESQLASLQRRPR